MRLTSVRTTLTTGDQALVLPRRGEVHVDPSVPEHMVPVLVAEAERYLAGHPSRYVLDSADPVDGACLAVVTDDGALRWPGASLARRAALGRPAI